MIILGTNSIKDTGYDVANSCRFNSGSSDYLQWNSSPAGNRQKFTFSIWFKRAKLGVTQVLASASYSGSDEGYLYISSGDTLEWDSTNSGDGDMFSSIKLRDTSAWYHLVWSVDTTQASAGNRMKFYLNGTQMTAWSTETQPNVNQSLYWNVGGTYYPYIGRRHSGDYFDGYMAEVVQVNNAQLAADSFGEFDDSGIWKPLKSVADLTFGDTGYYLNFQDSSALGNDVSGENHDWTSNNLTAIDQSTDTCTNNSCVINSLDNYYAASTFSEGNLKTVQGSSRYAWNLSTMAVASGKWYAEVKFTTSGSYALIGITDRSPLQNLNDVLGSAAYDYSIYQPNGDLYNNAGLNPPNDDANYAASYANGDIIGIALDCDNNKLYFSKGGAWSNGSGSWDSTTFNASTGVVTITAPASTNNGNYFFAAGDYESGSQPTFEWNFGSPPYSISSGNTDGNGYGNFEYAVPSGYFSLNTKNLAEYG